METRSIAQLTALRAGAPHPEADPIIAAHDVVKVFDTGKVRVPALRGVSLAVGRGEMVAVMGPSGSGKSTLMHILAALDKPTSGTVQIAGEDVGSLSDADVTMLRRKHIGFVFQFFNLLPMLSAEENVLLPLTIVQNLLVRGPSLVAAFHPLNALAVLGVAVMLARSGAMGGALRRGVAPVRGSAR